MAKGNMFQGMARGKVGDVVFSRSDGEQISRVRNRHPNNPRTNKQMYQRAVMATVMQAYSAGKAIFDHAFQGKAVGAENQRAFLSKNAKLLRGLIASEIEAGTAALNCNAAVVAPGAITPVPNEYMISEGSYPQNFFEWNDVTRTFQGAASSEGVTIAEFATMHGLVPGDIYTFVALVVSASTPTFTVRGVSTNSTAACRPESQYPCIFAYMRLQVKDVSANTADSSTAKLGDFFEITASHFTNHDILDLRTDDPINGSTLGLSDISEQGADNMLSFGCIRSRLDQDLRSTSFMHIASKVADRATKGMYGITSPYALLAWQQGTEALGDSDLILEGGDD